MQNLEQIRAATALKPAQNLSRSAVNRLPAMILSNGLLATAAFCNAEGGGENRAAMKMALVETVKHLVQRGYLSRTCLSIENLSIEKMIEELGQRDSQELQCATAEALAFIAYLKRFAGKE